MPATLAGRPGPSRGVVLKPVGPILHGYGTISQPKWAAWRRKEGFEDICDESVDLQVDTVAAVLDPIRPAVTELSDAAGRIANMSTELSELIYDAVRAIPAGTVISYGELAERVGRPGAALAAANILGSRPDADNWQTEPSDQIDLPWWRVLRSDGTMLGPEHEMTPHRIAWTTWARDMLISEGVDFTNDGRVASFAGRPSGGGGSARAASKPTREASPCWQHEKIQYSCRECAPQ